ncbi:hypothetical protein Bca52824_044464 [Brassica carinata]|uniref:Uncharacterized protein n=1 Tax=Brassica carinata TaxID=52824 RepID=A0A8X7RCZ2_BRACI|nr:hypothetical protein Bca52824_044464 [Brassica carinata]
MDMESNKQLSYLSVKEGRDDLEIEPHKATFQFSASNRSELREGRPPRYPKEAPGRRAHKAQPKEWDHSRNEARHYNASRDSNKQRPNSTSQGRSFYREIPRKQTLTDDNGSSSTKEQAPLCEKGVPLQRQPPSLPEEAIQRARGEVRDVMLQYTSSADPTEREARKERMRQAEEQGELEETAILVAQAALNASTQRLNGKQIITTPERIPVSQRLGSTPLQERSPASQRLRTTSPRGAVLEQRSTEGIEFPPSSERIPASSRLGPTPDSPRGTDPTDTVSASKKKLGRPRGSKNAPLNPSTTMASGASMINPVGDQELIKKINDELSKAYQEEEEYWRQRSRLLWLKLGDCNTGYFHAVSKNRRRANNLSVLEKRNGEMVYKEEDITKTRHRNPCPSAHGHGGRQQQAD